MKRFIGDKQFYKKVFLIAVPIMIQNGITNFVNMLDNIMVGQVGTEQMTGIAIVNQLIFVINVCIFGVVSGASIFGAQFYGEGNHEGMRDTFRFRVISCLMAGILAIGLFMVAGTQLISLYMNAESNNAGDILLTLDYGRDYLRVMLFGLIPFAIAQAYASTLRDTGKTILPMAAGIAAVFVNLALNYILIFGKFGAPVLGVTGAAIATVISRFVECFIIIAGTHSNIKEHPFIKGAYRSLRIPGILVKQILYKGTPLLLNEMFWSVGMAALIQCYSYRGLTVVAGMNISSTIYNVACIVYIALGNAIAIIVGQLLGAGKMAEAKETAVKLIFFAVVSSFAVSLIVIPLAPFFPQIYNTTAEVRSLATMFILIASLCMPLHAFMHACYFTLRSGGKTVITFIFDSVCLWCISIPLAFCLSRFTAIPIVIVYFICQFSEIIKCTIGLILVKKGIWLNKLIN